MSFQVSEHLRKELVRCDQDACRALGGTDGEWLPYDDMDCGGRAPNYAAAARRIEMRNDTSGESEGLNRFLNVGVD